MSDRPPRVFFMKPPAWGDAIHWFKGLDGKASTTRVYGWQSQTPRVGDRLHANMTSGRIGVYAFTKVEHQRDPPDMFFADVKFIGYEDQKP